MGINYSIKAEVIDITVDTPKDNDIFFVDTNVWYWLTYTRASQSAWPPAQYQKSNYPSYTQSALVAGSQIYHSGLSLAELTHLIEKAEREIYEVVNGQVGTKNYRHNYPNERKQVFAEVRSAWAQVTTLAEPLTVDIDPATTNFALNRLQTEKVDGYDLFILESMKKNNVVRVITDDGDFATVPGIQLFTANHNVIQAAKRQSKLKTR